MGSDQDGEVDCLVHLELTDQDEELALGIRKLRYVIIDEADRMIENGHFAELESIVRLTQRTDK